GVALVLLLLALALPGCRSNKSASPVGSSELIVSAAVSLREAFNEIAELERKQSNTVVHFNFGASGALQKQIESGAPADIFASAGAKQMDELAARNLIAPATRKDFARNVLVLIAPADNVAIAALGDLAKPEVKKIAVGNPKTGPAGQYTEQTLNKLKLLPQIQSK